jgi:hypothetical protein
LTLAYLDECGFSPSQPVSYSWTLRGERKLVPYENPQGRRANAIGVYLPFGRQAGQAPDGQQCGQAEFWWDVVPRCLRAEDVLLILEAIPRGRGALVVVLDNGSIHISHVIKEAIARLRQRGIHLYYLPPYSPELNPIEPRPNRCRASPRELREPRSYNGFAPWPPAPRPTAVGRAAQ